MVKGMQFMIDDSYRMDEVGDDESNQPSPSPPSPPPPPQSNNTGGKMAKGMQFLIKDSYTMDEVDDDDDPSPSLSSPTPPSQSNEEAEQHEKSDLKRPPEELLSSPQTLYVAEEKKSDSVGSSNALADVIILNESDESDDHENKEIATSLFADLSITPQSSNLHEEAIQSSSTQNNTIESSPAVTNAIDNNISGGKKTMAMVKFRVWDPAAPSKQFKFITATTVLLLPQSSNNNDGADDEKGNNESSSNDLKKIERLYSNSRQQKMQLQQRLSSVKEERRGSRDSTIYDDTTDEDETDTNNSNHANNGSGEDDEQQQQQEGGRRRTIKIDNKSIKNNLSQLSNDEDDDDDDENDDDKMNQLQVGNVVGIYLKKSSLSSTKSNNNNNSSTQQINNTTTAKNINEWKVGNSIRVLHNLNLIPLHTTGLEQLLHQIESNHPSLRELILDGITTIPQQYSSSSTTTTSQHHQHQLLTPLSTSHMEVLIEAIGKNTSIKKCSIRYSQITDDIASMLALALVDNTTMTSLSLRGNQLTSSSIKNFYSVLKSDENISLRLLDISDNSLIEDDVKMAFEQFMQQRNMKRKLILRAEKAKRIARGMPLLNEMLEEEEEEEEEEGGWRIGSGVVGGRRHVTNNGSDGGGSGGGCCVTVVCHPGIMDGTFYHETQQLLRRSDGSSGNSFGSYPQSVGVMAGGGSRTGEEEEEYQRFAESVSSDITGIGNEGARGSPSQQQQQQQLQPFVQPIGSELYPQSQPHYRQQQQQHHQEPMPYHPQQRRSNNRRLDPNYNMMFSSQGSSSEEGGNDSSTTSNTGNESLDQRQRQQLATVNGGVGGRVGGGQNHHNSPNRNRRSYNSRPSTTTASTTSNNSLNLSAQDYMDDKADEREIRRQLATQGQAIGAYAIDDEAPNRQEIRGRRTRVSRTESQRRARLAELGNNGSGGSGGGGVATTTIAEGDLVDADIERMEEYEYRNLSMSQKAFSKIGLGGEDKWTERVVCLTFGVCFLVLVIAISLYVARG